jgi:NAD(P)-dependent dehydrogenase (short-subunit alcohol dehydrogenase family)
MSLKDKVVVIVGATGGLGKAAALAFAEQGASLALISTDDWKLSEVMRELSLPTEKVMTKSADFLNSLDAQAAAQAVTERFSRVDVLVHVIGGWVGGKSLVEAEAEDLEFMLNQHVWTTFNLVQAFIPHLATNGRVLMVSSPLANHPLAKMGPYAMGKAAQEALLLTLAEEIKENGATANLIQVKSIDSEGKGKGTSLQEIVAGMLYLCSDEAAKLNGTRLPLY